ncbi:MAG: homoserine dehydrogenase [Archaeoglobi archaeon]|nr:MAG: homoserine dehydrogenase [Archaeoglobi archaeon]TDA25286.1 MAG: homoserine dehydrogenase [Archaeoglobi archaeon]TDA30254.1 MAG: homoserine dehydrogenase [Archaeoglobi archaeon]
MKIAIIGFGTVGQGVAELLVAKRAEIERKIGDFRVVAIADLTGSIWGDFKLEDAIEYRRKKGRLPSDRSAKEIAEEEDYDVMIEVTTTRLDESGIEYMKTALKKGASVITSNKSIAVDFQGLMRLAENNNAKLMYEATVGGVMPIIRLLNSYLALCEIIGVRGILNGTCNYILTRMEEEKLPYSQILSEAKEMGIAEANPSADVEGIDAGIKLVILANTIGIPAKFEDIEIVGITKITPQAFTVAMQKGYTIRLIAEASKKSLRVSPRLVPLNSPLAIKGTMNAAMIKTDTAGDIFVAGRGAGKFETATAILSDLYELVRTN